MRDDVGPRAKIAEVAEDTASVEDIQFFADWGAKLNTRRNADLICAAQPPSPTEEGVLARPSLLAPGRTFATYVAPLGKTCASWPGFQMARRSCLDCAPRPGEGRGQVFLGRTGPHEPVACPDNFTKGASERAFVHSFSPLDAFAASTTRMATPGETASGRSSSGRGQIAKKSQGRPRGWQVHF